MSKITFTLDGRQVEAEAGETIWEVAKREGTAIPHLCHLDQPGYRPDGNCRACVCEIEGERTLAASCIRMPSEGLVVKTTGERTEKARAMVFEMLATDMPTRENGPDPQSKFWNWSDKVGVETSRYPGRRNGFGDHHHSDDAVSSTIGGDFPPIGAPLRTATPHAAGLNLHDASHAAIAVNLDACIACGLCERACREVQSNDVIGMGFRGHDMRPVFDLADEMGDSTCVSCGECVQACPTGALLEKSLMDETATHTVVTPDREVDSVCPFCGVGCQTKVAVKDDKIIRVDGRDGPANENRLCVKGRFGFDYVSHPHRLTKPLIRREGAPKRGDMQLDPMNPWEIFREATWEEAMSVAANGLKTIRDRDGGDAFAGFGSAKGSNEEAYLFQKFVRVGFGTNNVDHCTRLCHASSVAALMEGVGSGAVSAPFSAALDSDCILIIGARPEQNHPVAATYIKHAAKNGASLIVADPRGQGLMRHAEFSLKFRPGTDVALLNAMLHTIIEEGLTAEQFIQARASGYEELKAKVKQFSPEAMAPVCGIPAETIRAVARKFATSERSIIFWGMGVSQHVHGTDNARCLIALSVITGHIGRPGTGLHPLRGQNNVQGASDAGLIPMMYPDYRLVENPDVRAELEDVWGRSLDPKRGLTVVEIMDAVHADKIKGMYVMGENPAMSDPDQIHARAALAKLECLVVQDIFLTETAWHADVVFPSSAHAEKLGTYTNTNRQVQVGRPVLPLPGEARQDWELIVELGQRVGMDWSYGGVGEVYEEMRSVMPSLSGIPWSRLEVEDCVTYPADSPTSPGREIIFEDSFPTKDGRVKLVPADVTPPAEVPDAEYPLVLTTGRMLEHWHTGSMTRRSRVLDALEPEAIASMNAYEIEKRGMVPGEPMRIFTRRGEITATLRVDQDVSDGMVFVPFCFNEAAANVLTNPQLDPFGKIPEFKFCAAQVGKVMQEAAE